MADDNYWKVNVQAIYGVKVMRPEMFAVVVSATPDPWWYPLYCHYLRATSILCKVTSTVRRLVGICIRVYKA